MTDYALMNKPRRPAGRPIADTFVTVTQAAGEKGVNDSAVRHAIRDGRLRAQKVGNAWVIRKLDLAEWQPIRGRGRKPKGESDGEG